MRCAVISLIGASPAVLGNSHPARPAILPVTAQGREQSRRQQGVAVLAALALADLEAHAVGRSFDVGRLQGTHFGDA